MSDSGSIKLNVLFFGATADAVRARSIALDVPQGSSSRDALEKLTRLHPELGDHKLLYSINQSYATGKEILKSGDELAVFTAVSGG